MVQLLTPTDTERMHSSVAHRQRERRTDRLQ